MVADVGAGTGKLTRELADRGYKVLAVEPNDHMRSVIEERWPGVSTYRATAESLPFAVASVDVVTVAQAFHLFDTTAAAGELHRVLRPGRACVILWNRRVQDELHDKVAELTEPLRGDMPPPALGGMERGTRADRPVRHVRARSFYHHQLISRAGLIERTLSTPTSWLRRRRDKCCPGG